MSVIKSNAWLIQLLGAFGILGVLLLGSGCVSVGPDHVDNRTVELDSAATVTARVEVGAGKLKVGGGASALTEAEFTYNVPAFRPDVSYSEEDDKGLLQIEQPSVRTVFFLSGQTKNLWDLKFSETIPMDIEFHLGATESQIDLGNLTLGHVSVESGVGDVHVKLAGKPDLDELTMNLGAGKAIVDLAGLWKKDVAINIEGGVGDISVRLPGDIGVKVAVNVGVGSVDVKGLSKEGEVYFSEDWENNPVSMELNIEGGVGRISVVTD